MPPFPPALLEFMVHEVNVTDEELLVVPGMYMNPPSEVALLELAVTEVNAAVICP